MARQPHGGLLSKTSESYVHLFVWCLLMLLGVISDVEASAVAAGRRKRLLLSSYKAKPNPNVFPQPDRRATLNIECFDHERDESGSRWIAERDSLSRPSCLGLLLVGLAANRFVVKAIVTLYIAKTIHKLRTSDPVRRSLYFWRHAGPIVVRIAECLLLKAYE